MLNEDPLTYRVFLRHAEAVCRARPGWTFFDVLAAREACALAGSRWPLYEAVAPVLGEDGCAAVWAAAEAEVRARFAELSPPIPGALESLAQLERRGDVRLGLIANQGREARDWLDALGVLDAFGVVALSEEVGRYKPDPELFRHALGLAGVEPSACLMVGDRLDNDIAPAAALGMATAWVRWPDFAAKGWAPTAPEPLAYLASLRRLAPRVAPPGLTPTLTVDGVSNLAAALGPWLNSA